MLASVDVRSEAVLSTFRRAAPLSVRAERSPVPSQMAPVDAPPDAHGDERRSPQLAQAPARDLIQNDEVATPVEVRMNPSPRRKGSSDDQGRTEFHQPQKSPDRGSENDERTVNRYVDVSRIFLQVLLRKSAHPRVVVLVAASRRTVVLVLMCSSLRSSSE
jgi:hypothetical protein